MGAGLIVALCETRMKTYFTSLPQFPLGTSTRKMYSVLSWYFEALLMKARYIIQSCVRRSEARGGGPRVSVHSYVSPSYKDSL